jgi:hypothetical protein
VQLGLLPKMNTARNNDDDDNNNNSNNNNNNNNNNTIKMGAFVSCTLHQMLLGQSSKRDKMSGYVAWKI